MNRPMVLYLTGRIIRVEAALLLLPALVGLYYHEKIWLYFLLAAAVAALCGGLLSHRKPEDTVIFAKEGFATVALAWIGLSAIGALPFWVSGYVPN